MPLLVLKSATNKGNSMKKLILIALLGVSLYSITSSEVQMYYITEKGKAYHIKTCRTIAKSVKIEVTLQEAEARGYKPCKVCKPTNN